MCVCVCVCVSKYSAEIVFVYNNYDCDCLHSMSYIILEQQSLWTCTSWSALVR